MEEDGDEPSSSNSEDNEKCAALAAALYLMFNRLPGMWTGPAWGYIQYKYVYLISISISTYTYIYIHIKVRKRA